jgi:hypothetical protein
MKWGWFGKSRAQKQTSANASHNRWHYAIARLCGTAPGAPIGVCDPPQPARNTAAIESVAA